MSGTFAHRLQVRRREEDYVTGMKNSIHTDFVMKANADWENKQHAALDSKRIQKKMSGMKAQEEMTLQDRRQALSDLLNGEHEDYMAAIDGLKETPEQRLSKMETRARSLRENTEIERKQFVEEAMYKRWRSVFQSPAAATPGPAAV